MEPHSHPTTLVQLDKEVCHSALQVDSVFSRVLLLTEIVVGLDSVEWGSQREEAPNEDVKLFHEESFDYIINMEIEIENGTQTPVLNTLIFYIQ